MAKRKVMTIEQLKEETTERINSRYGSVGEFIRHEDFSKVDVSEGSLRATLSNTGSFSFTAVTEVRDFLKMPRVRRKYIVTKRVEFIV